jgi:pimeloyl-ACP methyl ester carboxylesterase
MKTMMRISIAVLVVLASVLASNLFGLSGDDAPVSIPLTSVPTFSTEKIGRQGHFYVGGKWVGEPGKERMRGAMYVEVWVPKKMKHPYPILFVEAGGGQTDLALLQTPDGRPGWAYDFVNQGYTIYMMDFPGRGRAGYIPGLDGDLTPPRTAENMEEVWTGGHPPTNPQRDWAQSKKYTQWPSDSPNKGKIGDPVFDYFAKTELGFPSADDMEPLAAEDLVQLVDLIGKPVILLLHSRLATSGWLLADARPKLIKGIIAAEPWGPPIENMELDAKGPGLNGEDARQAMGIRSWQLRRKTDGEKCQSSRRQNYSDIPPLRSTN